MVSEVRKVQSHVIESSQGDQIKNLVNPSLFEKLLGAISLPVFSSRLGQERVEPVLTLDQFESLQDALDYPQFSALVEMVDRGEGEAFARGFVSEGQTLSPKAAGFVQEMYGPTLKEDLKKILLESARSSEEREVIEAIRASDPADLLKQASEKLDLPHLYDLGHAVAFVEREYQASTAAQMKKRLLLDGWTETSLDKVIQRLVDRAGNTENLEAFLIREGTFGTDPRDLIFQAGLCLLQKEIAPIRDQAFAQHFYDVIRSLRHFDTEALNRGQFSQLRDLAILSPQFQILSRQFGLKSSYVELVNVLLHPFPHELQITVEGKRGRTEKLILWGLRHFKPLLNSGTYGSLIYSGPNGEKLGVFKAVDAAFTDFKKWKSRLMRFFEVKGQEGYLPLPHHRHLGAMIAERATYLLDETLQTSSVPKTEILYAQGHKGSFQHFLHGYREAEEIVFPENPNESDLDKFQRFAILDYMLGNLDRKTDNWMAKMEEDGHFQDIKMIDNANVFPRGHLPHPATGVNGATWNQYAWKKLKLANFPLTQRSRELIQSFTALKIERVIERWRADLGDEYFTSFFTPEVLAAFRDRVKVLHKFASEEGRPFGDLGKYGTYQPIKKYLGEVEAPKATYVFPAIEGETVPSSTKSKRA